MMTTIRRVGRRLGRRWVYGMPAGMLIVGLLGSWLTGASWLLALTLLPAGALVAAATLDLQISRLTPHALRHRLGRSESRVAKLEQHLGEVERELQRLREWLVFQVLDGFDSAEQAARRLTPDLAPVVVATLFERGDALDAHALASHAGVLSQLEPRLLRRLRDGLRQRGYLPRALEVAELAEGTGAEERDVRARMRIAGEIAVLSANQPLTVQAGAGPYEPVPGRVVHLVGRSLPEDQVGYTLRTHYVARAQRTVGLEPHVVTQMGVSHAGEDYGREHLDGIPYHRIPGPRRGQVPLDQWLSMHAQRAADLVRDLRPAVLHAASDYLNALTAIAIGKTYGIPVVYESRGFWEETWLSRVSAEHGWDLERLAATHGLPEAYVWRREIEDRARQEAARVVTLDPIMAERIEAGGVAADKISIVPNAVSPDDFPVLDERDQQVAREHGIQEDSVVIGYISTLNKYEGIDILISAFAQVRRSSPTPVTLLIVGEGPARAHLESQAKALGVQDAIFTGSVPHKRILRYYSLIDIFVVPRLPTGVSQLVTPLKPYEALSTGRAVVLSNVRALAAIAEQSAAAELFEAGEPDSLATVLEHLASDPARRKEIGATGAAWVRAHRTWIGNAETYRRTYEALAAVV